MRSLLAPRQSFLPAELLKSNWLPGSWMASNDSSLLGYEAINWQSRVFRDMTTLELAKLSTKAPLLG